MSSEVFDAWIATPERDRLTSSEVHQAVEYRPITRYDVAGGYHNIAVLAQVLDLHVLDRHPEAQSNSNLDKEELQ